MEQEIYRLVALPDMHLPYEDKLTMAAVEAYLADNWWDEWLQLGDFMDLDYISRHTKDNLKLISAKTFEHDFENANRFLDRHLAAVSKKNTRVKKTLLEGNHDFRLEVIAEKDPRMAGMLDLAKNLRFEERGINFHRFWKHKETYRVGDAHFAHGKYCTKYHAQKMVEAYGSSVFYGHTHDVQSYTPVLYGEKRIIGQSLGHLAEYRQHYVGADPTAWQQAFGEFHFFPDGDFSYYVIRISDHRFVAPTGKVYDGRKIHCKGSVK
jgi:hypothetical protein